MRHGSEVEAARRISRPSALTGKLTWVHCSFVTLKLTMRLRSILIGGQCQIR